MIGGSDGCGLPYACRSARQPPACYPAGIRQAREKQPKPDMLQNRQHTASRAGHDQQSKIKREVGKFRFQGKQAMIVIAEPTYAGDDHVVINGAIIESIVKACGAVVFAATAIQHAGIAETTNGGIADAAPELITVQPAGGVSIYRMRHQWRTLFGLVRRHRAKMLVLLSAGPETLFVARGLVTRYPALRVFAVMHGNISTIVGWRSRDPRRRLIDLRSGLHVAHHPRIHLVVLEDDIRNRLASLIPNHCLVWPMPTNEFEQARATPWVAPAKLTLAFVGRANRAKGFGDIVALQKQTGGLHAWAVVGTLSPEFELGDLKAFTRPVHRLSRADYLAEIRRADYTIMSFGQEYHLTASASLLDCVTQRKPIIALRNSMLSQLETTFGAFGHLCDDTEAMLQLVAHPERLRDEPSYARFQRALDAIHAARLPGALAATIRSDLGCE